MNIRPGAGSFHATRSDQRPSRLFPRQSAFLFSVWFSVVPSFLSAYLMTDPDLLAYYAARADEYEKVYEKPERQRDLARLHAVLPAYFENRRVLEVACGTGYWTRRIAPFVSSMVACDLSTQTLAVARANQPSRPNVSFIVADAYDLAAVPGAFDSVFAGFWWSHVRHADLSRFLDGLHQRVEPESLVVFVDNRYVEGSNWPITHTDSEG